MRHAYFHSRTPPPRHRLSKPPARGKKGELVELQIVIFVVVGGGVVLCLTFVIIIIVVSNSNFRISTTIRRIRATLVPLHSASQYHSISIAISDKRRYFVLRSCCGTPQEHLSSNLFDVSQSIMYLRMKVVTPVSESSPSPLLIAHSLSL